jgi:hypothetical protein
MRRALDRLLPVFSPGKLIRRNISNLVTDGRNLNGFSQPWLPINRYKGKSLKQEEIKTHPIESTKELKPDLLFEQWQLLLLPHFILPPSTFPEHLLFGSLEI